METPNQPQVDPQFGGQQPIPNATAVLVLGILSIVFCWCYGIIGLVLGIIAVILSGKSIKLYEANPGYYAIGSYKNLKAGRVCGIIGLCLSSLYVVFIIIYIFIIGAALTMMPWDKM